MNSVSRRRITPAVFRWFALADFVAMILIIISGTAVRLTGSGLGCPDWPTCYRHRLSVPFSFHPWIEFGNRLVTASLVVVTVAVLVAALRRTPLRRDLVRLSAALVGGVVLDAVLGAIVVYAKLNPWLVCLHLVVSLAMVVLGAVLYHRSKYLYGPGSVVELRDPHFRTIARLLWLPFTLVVVAGTLTTGSGPHAGGSQGQLIAKRLPVALSTATWVHSVLAVFFVALVTGLLLAIWKSGAPAPLVMGVRRLALIGALQALLGFAQYLTHVPTLLVEIHVIAATSLAIGVTQFHLRQSAREREPGTRRQA